MIHERVDKLIASIRDGIPGVKFDMAQWIGRDGARICACIAGHASILAVGLDKTIEQNTNGGVSKTAAEWMGISEARAQRLFASPLVLAQHTDREWGVQQLEALKLEDA